MTVLESRCLRARGSTGVQRRCSRAAGPGTLAPAATPPAIVQRLNTALIKALANPALVERLFALGAEVRPSSSEELGKFIREDLAKWKKVVEKAGIKPE